MTFLNFLSSDASCLRCEQYTYRHCSEMLSYYNAHNVSLNCSTTQDKIDVALKQISSALYANHGAEINCLKGSRWYVLQHSFSRNQLGCLGDVSCIISGTILSTFSVPGPGLMQISS